MSTVAATTRKDLRRFMGDRRALVVNISLPFLITLIMGLSFGGGIFGQREGISAIPLDLVGSDLPRVLKDRLAEGLRESGFFEVAWTDSTTAEARVRRGEVAAAVVLPPALLEDFLSLEPVTIQLWKDPASSIKAGIVQQILERGLRRYQAGEAAYFGLWPETQTPQWGPRAEDEARSLLSGDLSEIYRSWREEPDDPQWAEARERLFSAVDRNLALQEALARPLVRLTVHDKAPANEAASGSAVNLFNYFLPSFSVFFLMFAVAATARDMHREREAGTLGRQLISPVGRSALLMGKWAAATIQGLVMLGVLYLAGGLAFQVNLGPDPFSLPLMVLLCCAAAAAFFLLLAQVTRTEKLMDNISTVVVLVSALIGGNMIPVDTMPQAFHFIGRIGFNYWANVGFSDIMVRDQSLLDNPQPFLVLAAMVLGYGGLNLLVARLRPRGGVWA